MGYGKGAAEVGGIKSATTTASANEKAAEKTDVFKGSTMVPLWSLALVFVLTLLFTILVVAIVLLVQKNRKLTEFRNKFNRNSGRVVIGRRRSGAISIHQNCAKQKIEPDTNARADIPDVKVLGSDTLPKAKCGMRVLSRRKCEISPIGKYAKPCEIILSPVSGVYANMDSLHDCTPPTYRTHDENSLHPPSMADLVPPHENSYFTPVLRIRNADGVTFSGVFRKPSAATSMISVNSDPSVGTASSPSTSQRQKRESQLETSEANPASSCDNTYLSFSKSVLLPPSTTDGR